jgi:hypothetical protein
MKKWENLIKYRRRMPEADEHIINEVIQFADDYIGDFDVTSNGKPVSIYAIFESGIPYASIVATLLSLEGKEVINSTLFLGKERVYGFTKTHLQGKRVHVFNRSSMDREAALKILRAIETKYLDVVDESDFLYITTDPYTTFTLDDLREEFKEDIEKGKKEKS